MLRSADIEKQLERGRILLSMTGCAKLESIQVLSLRELNLTHVFKYLLNCTNLQVLFLSANRIDYSDIELHMYKLKTVRKLDLSYNELTELPRESAFFERMGALQFLSLDGNQINWIEQVEGLRGAQALTYLSLMENPIQNNYNPMFRFEVVKMMPQLLAIDFHAVSFDEKMQIIDNKSVRYHSQNTFCELSPQTIASFVPDYSAAKHIAFLEEQLKLIEKVHDKNDPVIAIQRCVRKRSFRLVVSQMVQKVRQAVLNIQKVARGYLCRLRMRKELVRYFDSIGQVELTMSPEEVARYQAMQKLNKNIKRMVYKWRNFKKYTKHQVDVSKVFNAFKVRQQFTYVLDPPLNMRENRRFYFLKEQKYLVKHILINQRWFQPAIAQRILKLLSETDEYKLVKHVEIDLFDMPERAVLQISRPPTLLNVRCNKGTPSVITEQRSILELCISPFGDKELQHEQLRDLLKFKSFFRKMSNFELRVARKQIIPVRPEAIKVLAKSPASRMLPGQNHNHQQPFIIPHKPISLQLSSQQSSEYTQHQGHTLRLGSAVGASQQSDDRLVEKQEERADDHSLEVNMQVERDSQADKKLFSQILRKEGSDFMKIDLSFDTGGDGLVDSEQAVLKLLKVLIQWNRAKPENPIHFYVGDLLERQVAVKRIQVWFKQAMRIKRQRAAFIQQMEAQKHSKSTIFLELNQLTFLRCLQLKRAATTIQMYWAMYRLRRRIKMLSSLKQYLQGVTSRQLCVEEHLYENLTAIQYSCLQNNTIPEAHCFAFDFVQNEQDDLGEAAENGAWDLIYSDESKEFSAYTNRLTHDAIQKRFKKQCLPDWVVKGNLALSQRASLVKSDDRNNTTAIFHKTQGVEPTQVLDYNQIVAPQNRTFVVNNGLRFVVINCASVADAQRRALALAMITLNRKKGDFLKIFCPNQLFAGTFMPNIQCWWKLPEIEEQIPEAYIHNLTRLGGTEVNPLPLNPDHSHNGLILSALDYGKADQEEDRESLLIKRQRNNDELQMKLVLPRRQTEANLQNLTQLDIIMKQQQSLLQTATLSQVAQSTIGHSKADDIQTPENKKVKVVQHSIALKEHVGTLMNSYAAGKASQVSSLRNMNETLRQPGMSLSSNNMIEIENQSQKNISGQKSHVEYQTKGSQVKGSDNRSSMASLQSVMTKNMSSQHIVQCQNSSLQQLSQKKVSVQEAVAGLNESQRLVTNIENLTDEGLESVRITQSVMDKITKPRPVSNATVGNARSLKKQSLASGPGPYVDMKTQMQAEKGRKALVNSSYGLRANQRPPKTGLQPTLPVKERRKATGLKVGQGSLESGRAGFAGMHQSQTTKAESLGNYPEYSIEGGQTTGSVAQFVDVQPPNSTVKKQQFRAQSGLGIHVKQNLLTNQSRAALPADSGSLYTQGSNVGQPKVKSSLALRRPMTSVMPLPMATETFESNTGHLSEHSTLRDHQVEATKPMVPFGQFSCLTGTASQLPQQRVKSAIFHSQQLQSAANRKIHAIQTERQAKELREFNLRRQSERTMRSHIDQRNLETKSMNVVRQRTVSHLIQSSIKTEQESKLRLIQKLGKMQKEQNQVAIQVKSVTDQQRKSLISQQRAKSSYSIRTRQMQDKAQAHKLTSAVNMLNKVRVDQIKQDRAKAARRSIRAKMQEEGQRFSQNLHQSSIESSSAPASFAIPLHNSKSYQDMVAGEAYGQNFPQSFSNHIDRRGTNYSGVPGTSSVDSQNQTNLGTQRIALTRSEANTLTPMEVSLESLASGGPVGSNVRNIIVSKQMAQPQPHATKLKNHRNHTKQNLKQRLHQQEEYGGGDKSHEMVETLPINPNQGNSSANSIDGCDYQNLEEIQANCVNLFNQPQTSTAAHQSQSRYSQQLGQRSVSNQDSSNQLHQISAYVHEAPFYPHPRLDQSAHEVSVNNVGVSQPLIMPSNFLHQSGNVNLMMTGNSDSFGGTEITQLVPRTTALFHSGNFKPKPYDDMINKDIEDDLVRSGDGVKPATKTEASRAQQPALRTAKTLVPKRSNNQFQNNSHHHPNALAIPVVMKEYQLQTQKPSSKPNSGRPRSNNLRQKKFEKRL